MLVDCYEPLTTEQIRILAGSVYASEPIRGVVRYHENLTRREVDDVMVNRLGLMTVGVARNDSMRAPTAELGARDGLRAVREIRALGLPEGFTNWLDVEGATTATYLDVARYVNAWAGVVRVIGEAGMYEGWGINMTAAQLYSLLAVRRYWLSSPSSIRPSVRGAEMVQEVENVVIGGVRVDVDRHRIDDLGDSCSWVVA